MSTFRIALAGTVVAGALLLTACGSSDSTDTAGGGSTGSGSPSASSVAASFNDADVMFAQMMITHHEQAVEMAGLAATRASDAEVRSLAEQIKAAQEPEITRMRGWLKSWKAPESAGMPMGHGAGMMSDADMAGLKAAKGTAFDRKFAEMMIGHHRGAIDMAEDVRKNGRNEAVRQLTGKVITTQSAEVEQLQKIIDRI
ncbi:DUF305 domain-containing protein [Streptomyces sp. NBC_01262]|uniref:DUF305 domain-containing protein n=1 Tax=Streptomyces sp. NBC_01262 TaxID=2903803 RepID=UPI002E332FD2|nr:DUF305 domain-containing protein [Streptomyces sp. NBC_01262]